MSKKTKLNIQAIENTIANLKLYDFLNSLNLESRQKWIMNFVVDLIVNKNSKKSNKLRTS